MFFQHAGGEIKEETGNEKLDRINQIKLARLDVVHVIHRHGMDERTAFDVEAALIDAYPGLTNIAGGHGNSAFGSMHANQIVERYTAREMEFHHKILLINVNRTAAEFDLYHATQHAWKLDVERAARADYVVAIVQGLGVGVFRPEKWLKATEENFPGRKKVEGRYGFIGSPAQQEVRDMYVGTRTPEDYRKRGASNPIKYTYQ